MPAPASSRPETAALASATVAAWVLPGLGHVLSGQRRRGFILMVAIMGLYITGLLIGGVDVIDRKEDTLWYAAQMMAGPTTLIVDFAHQRMKTRTTELIKTSVPKPSAPEASRYVVSIGRVNEMGTLYCALAGLLNLLVILDVAWAAPAKTSGDEPRPALRGRVVAREQPS